MERPDSSSEEDDDRENLIDQNVRKPQNPRAPFHIGGGGGGGDDLDRRDGGFRSPTRRSLASPHNKRYMLIAAVFLSLFVVVLYFSVDVRNLFQENLSGRARSSSGSDSVADRLRESELRALYLLREQQSGLFELWNQTFRDSVLHSPNLTSNGSIDRKSLIDDLKFAVLRQISLNKEIQQALLLPHATGNLSSGTDNGDPSLSGSGLGRCSIVDQKLSERKTLDWKPDSSKFLFAICLSGQMSNHLVCLEKHMFFAALLNRVLVIPGSKVDYQYSRVLDINRINECLGRKAVVTFDEFAESKKNHIHINRFLCYFSLPQPCYVDEEHIKKLKLLGITMGKLETVWDEDIKNPSKKTVQDVRSKFSTNEDVIAIGDVFYADVEREWVMQPGGPLAHKCRTLVEPSRLIRLTAQRFVQTFLGKNFAALHFRRHGFLKFCNAKQPSCFFPIPQVADCITRVVERANTPVVYLSTDAAESETGLLQLLIVLNGKPVPLVTRPTRNSAEKWDALLYRHGLEGDVQVEAMLDKTICAMSSVFIGTPGSTFTEDILRLRKDWGSSSSCDEYICQGEEPNFIAENE